MNIKLTIKACRINAGYTLVEAADKLGINKSTLSKYENDSTDISMSLLNKISDLYQMPKYYIFIGKKYELNRIIQNKQLAQKGGFK